MGLSLLVGVRPLSPLSRLWPFQAKASGEIQSALRRHRRVLFTAPTGSGKTVVASDVILAAVRAGLRVVFLAHRREIVQQAATRLIEAGLDESSIGFLLAGKTTNDHALVQVCSIQTLASRERPEAELVVFDEAHRAVAPTYQAIADAYPDAKILGLTATPERGDGSGLDGVFDTLVEGPLAAELIALGHLAEPRTLTVDESRRPSTKGVKVRNGDFDTKELSARSRELVGSLVEHWRRYALGRPTVVFAVDVAHAKKIRDTFLESGVRAEHIDGSMSIAAREAILARLVRGETKIVTNCAVLTEGWDFPALACVVIARPTRSRVLYMQMCGRAMRKSEVRPVILDHSGNALFYGRAEYYEPPSLEGKKRKGRDGVAPFKRCEACEEVIPASAHECRYCGHACPPGSIVESDGDLVDAPKPVGCASLNGEPCDKLAPRKAMTPSHVAERKGRPWRCQRHAAKAALDAMSVKDRESTMSRLAESRRMPRTEKQLHAIRASVAKLNGIGAAAVSERNRKAANVRHGKKEITSP